MTHRRLRIPLRAYRIGDPNGEWPVFSGEGSREMPGRWNESGQNMIYLAEHLSTAMLEIMVRLNTMPPNQHFVQVDIPAQASYESLNRETLPDWQAPSRTVARKFGAKWFEEKRTLALIVPSAVTRIERNILINPNHPEFPMLSPELEMPLFWDERLFQ